MANILSNNVVSLVIKSKQVGVLKGMIWYDIHTGHIGQDNDNNSIWLVQGTNKKPLGDLVAWKLTPPGKFTE